MAHVILSLACKDCGADFGDWATLFDHVIHCTEQKGPTAPKSTVVAAAAASSQESTISTSSNGKNASAKSEKQPVPSANGRFACVCGLSYTAPWNLTRHQKSKGCQSANGAASRSGPFTCPYPGCGKKIMYERNYNSHLKFHEREEQKWAFVKSQGSLRSHNSGAPEAETVSHSSATLDADAIDVQMQIEL